MLDYTKQNPTDLKILIDIKKNKLKFIQSEIETNKNFPAFLLGERNKLIKSVERLKLILNKINK